MINVEVIHAAWKDAEALKVGDKFTGCRPLGEARGYDGLNLDLYIHSFVLQLDWLRKLIVTDRKGRIIRFEAKS